MRSAGVGLIAAFLWLQASGCFAQRSPQSTRQAVAAMSATEQQAAAALVTAANQDRASEGLPLLREDPDLTAAAWRHAQRMVQAGTLSHRLDGEADLIQRVQQAGVHCSTVAENIASGPSAGRINNEWMHSTSHRANLLDPRVNAIGVGVVEDHGTLFAVEDFAREVTAWTPPQQERQVASLLQARGLQVEQGHSVARAYCNGTLAHSHPMPRLIMRYSTTDLGRLPAQVEQGIRSGRFRSAAVAACNPANENGFSAYQIVVLLY